MSFETRMVRGFERESASDIDAGYEKATKLLSKQGFHPEDFAADYGRDVVTGDIAEAKRREEQFKDVLGDPLVDMQIKLATAFEAIVVDGAEEGWFGEHTEIRKTSEYDDRVNGVDGVLEHGEGVEARKHLALAFDVTFSPDVEKKFNGILGDIERGQLSSVKYYRAADGAVGLKNVPKVVIGADAASVTELMNLWLENDPRMRTHPIQMQMLLGIQMQLEVFERFARLKKQGQLATMYGDAKRFIDGLVEEKRRVINLKGKRPDRVFSEMVRFLNRVEQRGS